MSDTDTDDFEGVGVFSMNMDDAPQDELIILGIPSGDPEAPLLVSIGSWNEEAQRWEGDWRDDEDEKIASTDPIAWAPVPDIPEELDEALEALFKDAA